MTRTFDPDQPPPRASSTEWLLRGRVSCLDGLRGIAILLVLLAHVSQTHGLSAPGPLRVLAGYGALGVDLFFCVSGFLITLLLVRELERTRTISLRGFYMRRALRILPAYLLFVLIVSALAWGGLLA